MKQQLQAKLMRRTVFQDALRLMGPAAFRSAESPFEPQGRVGWPHAHALICTCTTLLQYSFVSAASESLSPEDCSTCHLRSAQGATA